MADIMDPCHDSDANGVLFEVLVHGRLAQGYVSCALLALLSGPVAPAEDWVNLYRRNRAVIDAAVARRAPAENWETVMLRRGDLLEPG